MTNPLKMYGYKVWFNGLKHTKTCSFPMKKILKINLELWYVNQKLWLKFKIRVSKHK
jgi:hypothetical protein